MVLPDQSSATCSFPTIGNGRDEEGKSRVATLSLLEREGCYTINDSSADAPVRTLMPNRRSTLLQEKARTLTGRYEKFPFLA